MRGGGKTKNRVLQVKLELGLWWQWGGGDIIIPGSLQTGMHGVRLNSLGSSGLLTQKIIIIIVKQPLDGVKVSKKKREKEKRNAS